MDDDPNATGIQPDRDGRLSADLDQTAFTQAARALGHLRQAAMQERGPDTRKWTGRVFGKRAPVGMPVVLDDQVCWIKCVQRGIACVRTSRIDPVDGALHEYCSTTTLRPYKLPSAVLLGKRKQDVKERKSAVKSATSKANANLPPKPGKQPRGRPRADAARPVGSPQLDAILLERVKRSGTPGRSKDIFAGFRDFLRYLT